MKIIVVAPHADDETLGACGYLLKQKDEGHELFWLLITNMLEEYGYTKEQCTIRNEQISKVAKEIGFTKVFNLGLKPAGLDEYNQNEIISKISVVFREVMPSIVLLPNKSDAHSDHKIVFNAAFACTKIFRHPSINTILSMQIISETDFGECDEGFVPNLFVDISDYIEHKVRIAEIYSSEIQEHPFPRSKKRIEALAVVNGGNAFCSAAEAFRVIKMVQ